MHSRAAATDAPVLEAGCIVVTLQRCGTVCGKKKREKPKTLNGRLPLEDSSDFDDPVLVLIVMMRSIV